MTRTFWFSFLTVISLWLIFVLSLYVIKINLEGHLYQLAVNEVKENIQNGIDSIRYEIEERNEKLAGNQNDDEENKVIDIHQSNPSIEVDPLIAHKDYTADAMLWALEEIGVTGSDYHCAYIKNSNNKIIFNTFANYTLLTKLSEYPKFHIYQHNNDNLLNEEYSPDYCILTEQALFQNSVLGMGVEFSDQFKLIKNIDLISKVSLVISGCFAIIFGFIIGRNSNKRLLPINSLCEGVQQGDLNTRIPVIAVKDEFDRLAVNVNLMLDQLAQHVQSVRHISDNIAHDLRTPVTRLRGQLDLLLRMDKKDDALIEGIIEESDLLISIFNALLRIAQLESNSFEENFKPLNIDSVLLDAVDLYEPMFEEKHILVKTDIDKELIINGDSDLWIQAFSNILDNAFKYSEPNGEIKIAAHKTSAGISITIHDCGKGIPRTEQDRVFQRFYRLSKHRASQGSGLGLSLVGAVCRQHKAKINLSNNNGLVVKIDIPFK